MKRFLNLFILVTFIFNMALPNAAQANVLPYMCAPGAMIAPTADYALPQLVGMRFNSDNPFDFTFILNSGNASRTQEALRPEIEKLSKYFLAALTIPEKDLWVNLSPYEQNRISTTELAQTDLGEDMLGEDYVLKQLAASLTYPELESGKQYWNKINGVGANNHSPVNSFNKVWIMPDKIRVLESVNQAVIDYTKLKVMTEADYLAQQKNNRVGANNHSPVSVGTAPVGTVPQVAFRQHILPLIEKEVNSGKNFAQLRQFYSAIIMAVWFKKKLHDTVLSQKYFDQKKLQGAQADDLAIREKIYNEYLKAFQQGVYNYVKKERVAANGDGSLARMADGKRTVPISGMKITRRAYFSGGVVGATTLSTEDITVPDGVVAQRTAQVGDAEADMIGNPAKKGDLPGGAAKWALSERVGNPGSVELPVRTLADQLFGTSSLHSFLVTLWEFSNMRRDGDLNVTGLSPRHPRIGYVFLPESDKEIMGGTRSKWVYDSDAQMVFIVFDPSIPPQEQAYAKAHDKAEAELYLSNYRLIETLAENNQMDPRDVVHILQSASERSDRVVACSQKGEPVTLLAVDEVDLQRYWYALGSQALIEKISVSRTAQRGIVQAFYSNDPELCRLSLQYEDLFQARGKQIAQQPWLDFNVRRSLLELLPKDKHEMAKIPLSPNDPSDTRRIAVTTIHEVHAIQWYSALVIREDGAFAIAIQAGLPETVAQAAQAHEIAKIRLAQNSLNAAVADGRKLFQEDGIVQIAQYLGLSYGQVLEYLQTARERAAGLYKLYQSAPRQWTTLDEYTLEHHAARFLSSFSEQDEALRRQAIAMFFGATDPVTLQSASYERAYKTALWNKLPPGAVAPVVDGGMKFADVDQMEVDQSKTKLVFSEAKTLAGLKTADILGVNLAIVAIRINRR